jgi:hypothetical protein
VKGLLAFLKYPAAGALLAGGALGVVHLFGPGVATELGADAGVSFATGVADFQAKIASATGGPAVAGGQRRRRRGEYA